MKRELKKIDILSLANVLALIYLVFGLVYFPVGIFMGNFSVSGFFNFLSQYLIYIISSIIGGWLLGAVFAFLYNFFSSKVGGVMIHLD
jgi:uncharacterized membrane protein